MNRKHGHWGKPEYESWRRMIARCSKPTAKEWPNYGGRGIRVCDAWYNFDAFLADVGPRPSRHHSIDRIDVNGNYEPGNVRWATQKEQQNNRRSNRIVLWNGEPHTLTQLCEKLGINRGMVAQRLDAGWPLAVAVTRKSHKGKRYAAIAD